MDAFPRIKRLPPYVFSIVDDFKQAVRSEGHDVIDFGMGNPDRATPDHIVDSLIDAAKEPANHRYSCSKGILPLRQAICRWYQRRFEVTLDPETETIVTIGSKEGLAHLAMALVDTNDSVVVPTPCYPVHEYGFIIAGANVHSIPLTPMATFCERLEAAISEGSPKPKVVVLNFPSNPVTTCVDLTFLAKVVALAKAHQVWVIHDFAYAELCFDGFQAPSILQVPGAKDIAVESYSMSKTYNMPGWRLGFISGNKDVIAALARLKSYMDYGTFAPVQLAAVTALDESQDCIDAIRACYQERRDVLCDGLNSIGWQVEKPKATMFVWAKIPANYSMGSIEFCQYLIENAHVAVSPGIGFGAAGDDHVRFALVEELDRTREAIARIGKVFAKDGITAQQPVSSVD